ncbi:hypothetical protein [Aneurinibacillus aneurinilyticus]|uniref:Uncharacterized protein n=2 Tax=Aneurinibacillus aneurinilyticus TaxID=1391 RepID=A0A848CQ30_ANEAE|nr:hypothetical protein [Aneurinibacillus aneurinilyticus]ERI04722.1 hypothetical protein HMPREF0083_05967 [Aneurinibacillus aneurinilyticus ATCC 12856]MED0672069.1 hypothetical protein [Aneurinibacillus aneurinilyticus]MED0709645.1 hypothetical protein [Aneurinibacillus aneurinilyticus]MED0726618.1 hypothetical protein [Aneurinibacillus aneurinilyticus]MED0733639.1 hypothetical protein [Aneurinibacillus aneurinilyticus]
MKKLLATVTILGASLLTFGAGSASAATNCPFVNGAQNFGSTPAAHQLNSANNGDLNNLVQQILGNNNKEVPVKQSNSASNCPIQLFNFNCPTK